MMKKPTKRTWLAAAAAALLLLLIICGLREKEIGGTEDLPEPGGPVVAVLGEDGEVFRLPLESFLVGVVAAEMPASFQVEALAAQAVAARTYIMAARAAGGRHADAIVCCDPGCCQAWRDPSGLGEDALDKIERAVAVTAGQVLYYEGRLAETPFCSCCGGRTESAAAVWGGERPWLVSVDCPDCGHAPRLASCRTFSLAEAADLLDCDADDLRAMTVLGYTEGGRVDRVAVGGSARTGTEVRAALALDSAAFTWLIQGQRIAFASLGFGHGVGLCQWGADGMAAAGASYADILARYYPGCELGSAY